DPDTLDTWFSSALWPFSTLGWPQDTEDLQYFYPTSVLVTAYDIIFFWVARMIFSGLEHTGREPFKYVFIHGLVRDAEGRKMSKSLGNGIDPLEVIEKFGTDALRFALCIGNSPGNDLRFSLEKVEACRNFANKVWNAARFVLMNIDNEKDAGFETKGPELLSFTDKWILSRINSLSSEVTENMEKFELGIALQKIYEFIWEEFCDWYIEFAKPGLYDRQNPGRPAVLYTLTHVLADSMKLLHPFMPFITEEIYQHLPQSNLFNTHGNINDSNSINASSHIYSNSNGDDCDCCCKISDNTCCNSIMISKWPRFDAALSSPTDEAKVAVLIEAIKGIRNIRSEMGVPPSKKAAVWIISPDENTRMLFSSSVGFFERLSSVSRLTILSNKEEAEVTEGEAEGECKCKCEGEGDITANAMTVILPGMEIYIPLGELIDIAKEKERLEKEKANLENELARAEGKLNNQGFLAKAPPAVVADEQAKKEKYQELYKKVLERIHALKID
ncbi:MAG: class I tRNA ligase family protein, partial [Clostridiales bacterium]|nr:class I tRNA ligase family protein [Clostridiales bacterium]